MLVIQQITATSHEAEIRKARRLVLEGVGLEATESRMRPIPEAFYFLCIDEKTRATVGLAESFMYSAMSSDFRGMAFGHVPEIDKIAPFSRMGHFRTIWIAPEARVRTNAFLKLLYASGRNLKSHNAEFCTLTTGANSYGLQHLYGKIGGKAFARFFHLDAANEAEAVLFLFRIDDFLTLPVVSRFTGRPVPGDQIA